MKKLITLTLLCLSVQFISAQDKYFTKTGTIDFEASVPSFEEVKASNKNTTAILNSENGEIASLVLVKGFRFKNALMEEHFNENYMESSKFSKATFKGTIEGFSFDGLTESDKTYRLNGTLNVRGKDKKISTDIVLNKKNGIVKMVADFLVAPEDFDIKIPKLVGNKIAKEIMLSLDFDLKKR
ncbi:YceI family protein [Flavobacteriaceae bacterium R38]|nr:YceI family protein [Flavobacteriaceae bacterium R38]